MDKLKFQQVVKTLILFLIVSSPAILLAGPKINVTSRTNSRANTEWKIYISPDVSQFSSINNRAGGSIAFEGSFEVIGSAIKRATLNTEQWNVSNPGFNPFTNAITKGTYLSGSNLFISVGSRFFINGAPSLLLTLETLGTSPSSISMGGKAVLKGTTREYDTNRISQKGISSSGVSGIYHSGSTPDSSACESMRVPIATACSVAIGYRNLSNINQCSNLIAQAITSCKNYGNIYAICSDASNFHERACSISGFSLCDLLYNRTSECTSFLSSL